MTITPYLNQILCGDCLTIMREMPNESVDLVVTSPPYNLRNTTGGGLKPGASRKWKRLDRGYSHHDDCMSHREWSIAGSTVRG